MKYLILILIAVLPITLQSKEISQQELDKWRNSFAPMRTLLKENQDQLHGYMRQHFDFETKHYTSYEPKLITQWLHTALIESSLATQYTKLSEEYDSSDNKRFLLVTHRLMQAVIVTMTSKTVDEINLEIDEMRREMAAVQNDTSLEQGYKDSVLPQYKNSIRMLEKSREQVERVNQNDLALVKDDATTLMQLLVGS